MRAAIVFLALLSSACGGLGKSPSSPTEYSIEALVIGECRVVGIEPNVVFAAEDRLVDGGPYGYPGLKLPAAMSASRTTNTIVVYPAAVGLPEERLRGYARHECCHLALQHATTPERTEEAEAESCVQENY